MYMYPLWPGAAFPVCEMASVDSLPLAALVLLVACATSVSAQYARLHAYKQEHVPVQPQQETLAAALKPSQLAWDDHALTPPPTIEVPHAQRLNPLEQSSPMATIWHALIVPF